MFHQHTLEFSSWFSFCCLFNTMYVSPHLAITSGTGNSITKRRDHKVENHVIQAMLSSSKLTKLISFIPSAFVGLLTIPPPFGMVTWDNEEKKVCIYICRRGRDYRKVSRNTVRNTHQNNVVALAAANVLCKQPRCVPAYSIIPSSPLSSLKSVGGRSKK